ncbi:RHS repeat domain-containing protein [Agromyces silvae]|uniref:RHS repeat domain-containing protein n=1 Tax=Agromyces silvae TaxID=3388266 RepID=UPI00280A7309|nr:RHS repeat-associated core domain-containing protein [Agromyces protaetiae]
MLVVGVVSPVWAGEAGEPGVPPVVELGSFGVGDGLEGVVNEVDGSFGVVVPVAGVSLGWDSRVGVDRYGFGVGWGLGFAVVEVEGGVRVSPASGGVFEAADSVPSGLLGYSGSDVVFRQVPGGVLPGRADGVVGEQSYAFELHELGGVITYFNAAGDPVAKVAAGGDRSDWGWVAGNPHRLGSVVSVDGVVTELDWSDPGEVLVRPGVNVPAEGGGAGEWRVQLVDSRVSEVADPVGGRSLVGYDRAGRVERVVSGSGAVTTVTWRSDTDAVSRVDRVAVTDATGTELSAREWRQLDGVLPSGWPAVDAASVPGAVAGAVGGARSVEVSDGKTRVVSSFDEWGRLAGKRVVVSSSAGEQTVQEQELTYPDGAPVGVGDLARKPVAAEVRSLDVSGGVRAGTETYEYDELGRMVSARDAADRITTTTYQTPELHGIDAVTVTGPDGVAVTEVRDELGRVVQRHDNLNPDGAPVAGEVRVFQRHAFPAPGVEETTDAWGATTRIEQDVHGRPVELTLPNGLVQVTHHDDVAATVTTGTTPTGRLADAAQISTSHLDSSGRVIATDGVRADSVPVPVTSTVYDGFGRQIEADNGTIRTNVGFDNQGNPATTTVSPADPAASEEPLIAERRFDAFGTSLEKTMTVGGEARSGGSRELDLLGRPVLETDQAGGTTRYEYTADGLPARVVTSAGQVTAYTYDAVTRAVTEVHVEAPGKQSVVTGFASDETTGRVTGVFDPADRAGTEIEYTHDGFGNVRTVQYPAEQAGGDRPTVEHEYDRHGRKTATTDIAGNRSEYGYAADGFLSGVVQTDASGQEFARVGYTPDEYGRVARITRGNGVVTEYAFTSAGEIRSEITTGPDGSVQAEREYEYDPATGNLTVRIDRSAGEASGDLKVERREYAYDHLNRLTSSTIREGDAADAPVVQTVGYDITVSGQVGVETTTDGASGAVTTREFTYSPVGELQAITTTLPDGTTQVATQAHDAAGNLTTAADGTAFEWDAANRQTGQVRSDGTRVESSYWADGSRKARTTSTESTTYYWDGTALINDTHVTADQALAGGVASYLIGASRHARTTHPDAAPSSTQYFGTDRHGNVTELTGDTGAITGTYEYSDYGVAVASEGIAATAAGQTGAVGQLEYNPFQYASEYTHADGTQFLRERTYDPTRMGFTSKDVESLHDLYGYTNANPIMFVDPSGRYAIKDGFAIFMNGLGMLGGLAGAALALGSAFSGGGLGLMVFGVASALFGAGDAVFSGVEIASLVTGTRFMSEDEALGVGAGLALGGLALGGIGKYLSRTAGAASAPVVLKADDAPADDIKQAQQAPLNDADLNQAGVGQGQNVVVVPVQVQKPTVVSGQPSTAKVDPRTPAQKFRDAKNTTVFYTTEVPLGEDVARLLNASPTDMRLRREIVKDVLDEMGRRRDNLPRGMIDEKLSWAIYHVGEAVDFRPLNKLDNTLLAAIEAGGLEMPERLAADMAYANYWIDYLRLHADDVFQRSAQLPPQAEEFAEAVTVFHDLVRTHVLKY